MRVFSLLCLLLVSLSGFAAAQESAATQERDQAIAATDSELDSIREDIESGALDSVRGLESQLREMARQSRRRLDPVNRALEEANQSLNQLGPAPGEGAPPESEPLAARRDGLRQRVSVLQGQRTRILANVDEASSLLTALSAKRLSLLYREMLDRGRSFASPSLWTDAGAAASGLGRKISGYFASWGEQRQGEGGTLAPLAILLAAFAASFLIIGPVHQWMRRTFTRSLEKRDPTPGRRVAIAGVKMIARLVPGLVGGFIVIETSRAIGLLGDKGLDVAHTIWLALVAFLLVEGFTSGLFSPRAPNWRIAPVDVAKGRRASSYILAIVAIFGLKSIFTALAETADAGPALITVLQGMSAVAIGALLFLLCRRALWMRAESTEDAERKADAKDGEKEAAASSFWIFSRRIGRLIGLAIIVAAVAGYVQFADFAASRLYFLSLILAVAWFLRAAIKESAYWAERRLRSGEEEKKADKDDEKQIIHFWIGAAVDILILLALAPVVLTLIGLGWRTVRDLIWRAFLGFRVGGVSISLADILIAIAVFFVILGVTRFMQGALQRGPFKHSRLDPGVQNSLTTILGYLGLLIALLVGVMSLGFDLSNLAIIAGALSVGIGFGLQSIVNNFVSGLILLFERPIKVGDWIVTTSGEGTVKKISVRSTEIETFNRSSIIVPNSELISQSVTNWTHKNKMGRVIVPVGVSYSSDPDKVQEVLLKCAQDHPLSMRYPEAFVTWQDFGASSLDFDVRMYIADIGETLKATTSLRFAIFKALKEAGIEIPFPQRDVYIKSMPASKNSSETGKDADKSEVDVRETTQEPEGRENPIPQEMDTEGDD